MGDAQQAERAALARRLIAVGTFTVRRLEQSSGEHEMWCVDDREAVAAEIGAELGISRGRASSQMHYGQSLLERFPKLGDAFVAGLVDFRVIAAAIFRTDLITDLDVLAAIDEQLAAKAPSWNRLSRERVTELVDWMVIEADPEALRVAKQRDADRHIDMGLGTTGWPRSGARSVAPTPRRSTPNSATWRPPFAPTIRARTDSAAPTR